MAQSLPVEWLVGIRHIYTFFKVAAGQPLGYIWPALDLDGMVFRLAPDVRTPAAATFEGVAGEVIIRHDAERRDDILGEVFVLIIAEHQDKVRMECLDRGARLVEG